MGSYQQGRESMKLDANGTELYRGFSLHCIYPPIPTRHMDWGADIEGYEEEGIKAYSATKEGLRREIDTYISEDDDLFMAYEHYHDYRLSLIHHYSFLKHKKFDHHEATHKGNQRAIEVAAFYLIRLAR